MRIRVVRIGHFVLQRLEFVMQFSQFAAAGYRLVQHAPAGHVVQLLPKVGNAEFAGNGNGTFIGLFRAFDETEKSGFTATVRTHKARFFSRIDLKAEIREQNLPAILFDNI